MGLLSSILLALKVYGSVSSPAHPEAAVRYAKAEEEECRGRTQTMLETQLSNFSTFECFSLVQFREISLKFEALVPSTQKP